jgi:hypothetical protein
MTITLLAVFAILLSVLGGLWLSAHGDVTFGIPHVVHCRIAPYWRTYYANVVLFLILFFFSIFYLVELYFEHTMKIGSVVLIQGKPRKKGT